MLWIQCVCVCVFGFIERDVEFYEKINRPGCDGVDEIKSLVRP